MKKKEISIITTAITTLTFGGCGITLLSINNTDDSTTIHESQPINEFAIDDELYENGVKEMDEKNYEEAINHFIAISTNYTKIKNVKQNLLSSLVLYTYSIREDVNNLVSNPNADASSYTNAMELIDKSLSYLDTISKNNVDLSSELKNQRSYVETLINIYKLRKEEEPFKALTIIEEKEEVFTNNNFYVIDLKNDIIDDCEKQINNKIKEYNSNKQYTTIIDYIDSLDKNFIPSFIDKKETAKNNYFKNIKNELNNYIYNHNYLEAKNCVDKANKYLSDLVNFKELYEQWHNYSDSKLFYKKITDDSNVTCKDATDINGINYKEVIILSKRHNDSCVEFSLNNDYSTVSGTFFLTNYNYSIDNTLSPISILITDDNGKVYAEYEDLSWKTPIEFTAKISGVKYLRFNIISENSGIKIGIRDGTLL